MIIAWDSSLRAPLKNWPSSAESKCPVFRNCQYSYSEIDISVANRTLIKHVLNLNNNSILSNTWFQMAMQSHSWCSDKKMGDWRFSVPDQWCWCKRWLCWGWASHESHVWARQGRRRGLKTSVIISSRRDEMTYKMTDLTLYFSSRIRQNCAQL